MSKLFITESENYLSKKYIKDGYIIVDIKNTKSLDWIRNFYLRFIKNYFNQDYPNKDILNHFHKLIKINYLKNFRLKLIQGVNKNNNFRQKYFDVASPFLNEIVGNELVMQNRVNLSIQLPKDKSSLLDVHADTWSETLHSIKLYGYLCGLFLGQKVCLYQLLSIKKLRSYFKVQNLKIVQPFPKIKMI